MRKTRIGSCPVSTCDIYVAYDTRISSDSNTNEINTVNRNTNEQLKAIREEKRKEYLQNTSTKSLSQENIVIETNEKNDRDNEQSNDTHITTMKLKANIMQETISFVSHEEHKE